MPILGGSKMAKDILESVETTEINEPSSELDTLRSEDALGRNDAMGIAPADIGSGVLPPDSVADSARSDPKSDTLTSESRNYQADIATLTVAAEARSFEQMLQAYLDDLTANPFAGTDRSASLGGALSYMSQLSDLLTSPAPVPVLSKASAQALLAALPESPVAPEGDDLVAAFQSDQAETSTAAVAPMAFSAASGADAFATAEVSSRASPTSRDSSSRASVRGARDSSPEDAAASSGAEPSLETALSDMRSALTALASPASPSGPDTVDLFSVAPVLALFDQITPTDLAEDGDAATVGVSFLSEKHVFSIDDIVGGFDGVTYSEDPLLGDPLILDTSWASETPVYVDKSGNALYPIDSEFGFYVQDFLGAIQKVHDYDYGEGWAGDLTDYTYDENGDPIDVNGDGVIDEDDAKPVGLALHNAATETFISGQPLGTWAAGLGGNTVKASTEHYDVMATLLSDQAHAGDEGALYALDNNLRILDLDPIPDGDGNVTSFADGPLQGLYVNELTGALETAVETLADPTTVAPERDFNGDGVADDYTVGTISQMVDGVATDVAAVDLGSDGTWDISDSTLNGLGTVDLVDILEPNESTVTYDIAFGDDYSVTLKDDGKLLYRWGTAVKRPNDIRMDVKLDLPDEWTQDSDSNGYADANALNDGKGYYVSRAELVIKHDITNNPNDQVRPEDYENEDAVGRKPAYYIVIDPDNEGEQLWVSPNDAYAGAGDFLPSYFKLTDTGEIDMTGDAEDAVYFPPNTEGESVLAGYRNRDADGNLIGTVLLSTALIALNDTAGLAFESEDLTEGFTNEWFTSMDRDPFEWSYDQFPDDPFRQDFIGFASRDAAEAAGYTDDALVSGPRWRLAANKFGQDIPGVTIPTVDNSAPPFQHDNIGYPVGTTTTTTLNLLDWESESPLNWSSGWTLIDPTRLDEDRDGIIDEGWQNIEILQPDLETRVSLQQGDALVDGFVLSAVTPNGQTLTSNFLDVAVYLKGDRQDSAKIYDIQLIVEYEADPTVLKLYDYGDAPDDGTTRFYQTSADMDAARAQIMSGFYLGAPVDGVEVLKADIDSENAPLVNDHALGDDLQNVDDEGNATVFLTPLVSGQEAWIDVSASIDASGLTEGYLFAWFDLDGNGVWDDDELVLDGEVLVDGSNMISFSVPDYQMADLADESVFTRFILSDTPDGVAAYDSTPESDFHGEVEDYLVNLTSPYDDVTGRLDMNWTTGLSNGEKFVKDAYGSYRSSDWVDAVVGDFNGDGIDDIGGLAASKAIFGLTNFDFDPTTLELDWRYDFSTKSLRGVGTVAELFAVDFDGNGSDELVYRTEVGRIGIVSKDGTFGISRGLPKWDTTKVVDLMVGDFDGDGKEELAGRKLGTGGNVNNWQVIQFDEATGLKAEPWGGAWAPQDYTVVSGDFNGDGFDDIFGMTADGQWVASYSEGDKFDKGQNLTKSDADFRIIGVGDANGDGVSDVFTHNAATGHLRVGFGQSESEGLVFTEFSKLTAHSNWADFGIGDFNGDGLDDVSVRNSKLGVWKVIASDGEKGTMETFGKWSAGTDWTDVMVGNFDAMASIVDSEPVEVVVEDDGHGHGGSGTPPPEVPTPADVLLNTSETAYRVSHTFSTDDIQGGFDGATQGKDGGIIDFGATPTTTKDGVSLYPIDSEFGFVVTDFIGAQDKTRDGLYTEGWAGDLLAEDGTTQLGLVISNARTDFMQSPNILGTWLVGMGGDAVKASTEHYSVMQSVLSDQSFPGDSEALLPLDDDLRLVDYEVNDDGTLVFDADDNPVMGTMHGLYVWDIVQALQSSIDGVAERTDLDFDRDGVLDSYTNMTATVEFDGVDLDVAAIDLTGNGQADVWDRGLNGFGTAGIADILDPNESSMVEDIAVSTDYSVTLKDDGKLLYRWGNLIKRPNDVRASAEMQLPDEWTEEDSGVMKLFHVTAAELVVNHTVTNNPNDQIRPEDFENEAAIGNLPSYTEVLDSDGDVVQWVSTEAYYSGNGTLYEAGTVLRDFTLPDLYADSLIAEMGAMSSDLVDGFTNEWYTTMDREPFQAVLNDEGGYELGPRWRLQPNKYGQDLPSVEMPQDPQDPLPITNGEEKYEVGVDTTTVINLLDWAGVSPLTLSAGWMTGDGTVSSNGLNMTSNFDLAFYIKGDMKPVTVYDSELVLSYETVTVHDADTAITGTAGDDILVGQGGNTFFGDTGADVFVLGYGEETALAMGQSTITGFNLEEGDALGVIGFDLDPDNYNVHIQQEVTTANDLLISLDGHQIATLEGVSLELEADNFYFA